MLRPAGPRHFDHVPKRRSLVAIVWALIVLSICGLAAFQLRSHQRLHMVLTQQPSMVNAAHAPAPSPQSKLRVTDTTEAIVDMCHAEPHNEYPGDVVQWADNSNMEESADGCCQACLKNEKCNVWVWCANPGGCGQRKHGECWLKRAEISSLLLNVVKKNARPDIPWTSGLRASAAELREAEDRARDAEQAERRRKQQLRDDPELPLVFLDVEVDGKPAGRIEAVLFARDSPLAAENMRQFCTGEHGPGYHLKGAYFYRIIDRFIDQTGVEIESIYGGRFDDDPGGLQLKHDRPYLLSIANSGHNTNTAHFSITVAPAPHLNGNYVIFGECVSGFDVIEKVNRLSLGQPNNELLHSKRAQIVDTGQLRRGTLRTIADARMAEKAGKGSASQR